MTAKMLIELVDRWCDLLPQPDVKYRLHYLDRETLERLVYLIRQGCRCRQQ